MTKGSYPAGGGKTPSVQPVAGPRVPPTASTGPKPSPKGPNKDGMMPKHAARHASKFHRIGK